MVRLLGFSWVVLAACADNPVFGVTNNDSTPGGSEGSTGGPITSTAPPTSSDPSGGPSSGPEPTGVSGQTATTDEPGTSTSPGTTAVGETTVDVSASGTTLAETSGGPDTEDTVPGGTTTLDPDGGTTLDPVPLCQNVQLGLPSQTVVNIETMMPLESCQYPVQAFPGHGRFIGGKLQWGGDACPNQSDQYKYEFGKLYLGVADREFCGEIHVYWLPECKIGALYVQDFQQGEPIFGVYHSPTEIDDPSYPFAPTIDLTGSCGCPDMGQNCCEFVPGSHDIVVDGGVHVPSAMTKHVQSTTWANYQTFMPIECVNNLDIEVEVHWSAALDPP